MNIMSVCRQQNDPARQVTNMKFWKLSIDEIIDLLCYIANITSLDTGPLSFYKIRPVAKYFKQFLDCASQYCDLDGRLYIKKLLTNYLHSGMQKY